MLSPIVSTFLQLVAISSALGRLSRLTSGIAKFVVSLIFVPVSDGDLGTIFLLCNSVPDPSQGQGPRLPNQHMTLLHWTQNAILKVLSSVVFHLLDSLTKLIHDQLIQQQHFWTREMIKGSSNSSV